MFRIFNLKVHCLIHNQVNLVKVFNLNKKYFTEKKSTPNFNNRSIYQNFIFQNLILSNMFLRLNLFIILFVLLSVVKIVQSIRCHTTKSDTECRANCQSDPKWFAIDSDIEDACVSGQQWFVYFLFL